MKNGIESYHRFCTPINDLIVGKRYSAFIEEVRRCATRSVLTEYGFKNIVVPSQILSYSKREIEFYAAQQDLTHPSCFRLFIINGNNKVKTYIPKNAILKKSFLLREKLLGIRDVVKGEEYTLDLITSGLYSGNEKSLHGQRVKIIDLYTSNEHSLSQTFVKFTTINDNKTYGYSSYKGSVKECSYIEEFAVFIPDSIDDTEKNINYLEGF